jgi:hemolysin activation/secretion protein
LGRGFHSLPHDWQGTNGDWSVQGFQSSPILGDKGEVMFKDLFFGVLGFVAFYLFVVVVFSVG